MKKSYTITGFKIYSYFIQNSNEFSTDPNFKYTLPDGLEFSQIDEIEDWIIKMAEQIKSERQKIIMNYLVNLTK